MRALSIVVVVAITVWSIIGCTDKGSEPTLGPSVNTTKPIYSAGDHIRYVVANSSSATIYLPTCCSDVQFRVERLENGRWVRHAGTGPCDELMCPSLLIFVDHERPYIDSLRVNESGTYRLRVPYLIKDTGSETQELISRPFIVQ